MLRRQPLARPARAIALAAAATLALSACGGSANDPVDVDGSGSDAVAAKVGDEVVTVGDVQRTTRELGTVIEAQSQGQPGQEITADQVVALLVQVPSVLEFADEQGTPVPSAGSVRQQLAQVLPSPSDTTVDFLRANSLNSQLDEAARKELSAYVQEQDVTVSPRYAAAVGESPDWLQEPAAQDAQLPTGTP
ncbi:SurA N-terminal domain-containing protein [Janibacter terrae]|uniref:hypothetical protein n=1 Tax=Janibacter terrae TaxID=103817 RepID=UPI000A7D9920|nr:hypothetical protein [Janibacter terrae]